MSFWDRLRSKRAGDRAEDTAQSTIELKDGIDANPVDTVAGERGVASIHGRRSLQARISNLLAGGLLGILALGFLAWYYSQTFPRQSRTGTASESRTKQAQAEMKLPPLGRVDPPAMRQLLGPSPDPPPDSMLAADRSPSSESFSYGPADAYGYTPSVMPEQYGLNRRLSGPVFVNASSRDGMPSAQSGAPDVGDASFQANAPSGSTRNASALAGLLEPTTTPAVQARVLPTQRLLLPKGAFVDCTLETAIDSSLPGMTTCITATDTFGADGSVVLLERGTKLVGETRGDVKHGTARVYVLWTEARTPDGVVVPLASAGTDELGRAGLPGEVNRHFWERFGAAILVSVIDGAVQAAVQQSSSNSDGTVIVNPSTSRDIMTEVLRSTINIPPTVAKPQGDRIAVLVARDLDFRTVYELRPTALAR